MGKQHQIHPGVHGGQHAVDRTKELLHSLHLHAVAGDKAGKAHFAAQQAGDDAAGHGGGHTAVIQRGEQDVRRHDGGYAVGNGSAEGSQLHPFQFIAGLVYTGQGEVAVQRSIAVAGEMFGQAEHAAILQAADHTGGILGHGGGGIAITAHPDDGVGRVAVDIHAGGQVKVDAQTAQLFAGQLAGQIGGFGVTGGGQRHGAWYIDAAFRQAGHSAALLINHDKSVVAGFAADEGLQVSAQGPQLVRAGNVFAEKDDVADLIFFDHLHQLRCEGGSGKASDKALADTFKVCHV